MSFNRRKEILKRVLCFFFVSLLMILAPASTYALNPSLFKEYSQADIYFYDPSASSSLFGGGCSNLAGGNNYNYAGAEVFSSVELEAIAANQPFYEKAASKYDFPWQILAILHKREYNLQRSNPNNGQGVYQLYSYTDGGKNGNAFLPAGVISDEEFQRQTDIAANLIATVYGDGLDLNTDSGIKRLFYYYNGAAQVYYNQAIALGFTPEEASDGEGSPYVMNRFDLRRDPTVEPTKSNGTWGQVVTDGGGVEYPANSDFGAFVMYVALGGSSIYCSNGDLVSGGMNLEQAQAFMQYYKDEAEKHKFDYANVTLDGVELYYFESCGGALTNCVAFSRWFVSRYTDYKNPGDNDGRGMARLFINAGFEDGGHVPRAYAIFSRESGDFGHTGVVLGVDEARGKIILGEANCTTSDPNHAVDLIMAYEDDLENYMTDDFTYAYTDSRLQGL